MKLLIRRIVIITILFMYILTSCSTPISQSSQTQTVQKTTEIEIFPPTPEKIIDRKPEILPTEKHPTVDEILNFAISPDWNRVWVYGYLIDNSSSIVYYINAWLSRDGHGSLLTSKPRQQLLQTTENRSDLFIADQNLTDGELISSRINTEWINVESQWKFHPFEKFDRFMSYFFPIYLQKDSQWEFLGQSYLANREAWVIQNNHYRIWVDKTTGTLIRTEVFSGDDEETVIIIIQIDEIEFNVDLPARTIDVVPTSNYLPTFLDQPLHYYENIDRSPLDIFVVTRNTNDMTQGYLADLYITQRFLGSIDLGTGGLYCGRSYDWNSFAYLYSKNNQNSITIRWINLSDPKQYYEIEEIENPSAPVWSPNTPQFVVSGRKRGIDIGISTFLILPDSFEVIELGEGSLVPPAWSDDGNFVYSLDHTFQNILIFDVESKAIIDTWAFDAENWKIIDEDAWITNQELNKIMPRDSFRYIEKCRIP